MVLKRTFVHTYVGGRKADLPREVGSTPEGKVNATAQNAGFLLKELRQKKTSRYLSYAPPAYEYGTRPFLRWVLSQGRSPTRQAVPKMPRTPSAFPFSGRLRRRAINPTPPKRVKAWGRPPEARGDVSSGGTHPNRLCGSQPQPVENAPPQDTKHRQKNEPIICRCLPTDTT